MRVWKFVAITAISLGLVAGRSDAQDPGKPNVKVGVIDIGYIFENHPTLDPQLKAIDAEIERVQKEINDEREKLMAQVEGLRKLDDSSADFKMREEQLAKSESQLKLDFVRKEKDFAEKKAAVIYSAFKQIEGKIKQFAEYNGMDVVLRYQRQEMDPKKPMTVSAGVSKSILYFNPNYDLTDPILNALVTEMGGNGAPQAAQANGQPRR